MAVAVAFGLLFMVTAVLVAMRPLVGIEFDLAALAVIVVACGLGSSMLAGLVAGGLAWADLNGFLVDRGGDLRWHGRADAYRLLLLVAVGLGAGLLRVGWSGWVGRRRSVQGPGGVLVPSGGPPAVEQVRAGRIRPAAAAGPPSVPAPREG